MKLDLALAESGLGEARRAGRLAATAGFQRVWTTESTSDPFLQALAAFDAGAPEVGTGVAIAFARTPMAMAYPAWDLAAASGGRFYLGLGSQVRGHIERRFAMPWSAPVERMRDFVAALRAIWHSWRTGEALAYEGRFYRHSLMTPVFTPPAHDHAIPIGVAAVGTRMTEMAGEMADMLIVHGFTNAAYLDSVTMPALQAGLDASGRPRSALEVTGAMFMVMGDSEADRAGLLADARDRIAFYGSTPSYRPVFEAVGRPDAQDELYRLAKARRWDEMKHVVDDDLLAHFVLIGTPEQMPALISERFGGRLDRVSSYYGWPGVEPDRLADVVREFDALQARATPSPGSGS